MRTLPQPVEITPRDAVLGFVGAIILDRTFHLTEWEMEVLHGHQEGEPQKAVYTLVLLLISVGLSLLAGYLLKKNQKNPMQDERPTPLASRGSYVAWMVGVRRLGYTLTWAGERYTRKEKIAGGKGGLFDGPEQDVYIENGMHVLGVGPFDALYTIEQGGQVIFTGPITPLSHPSGTTVDLGGEGAFTIYWGEDDQPVNTFLGNSARLGVSSRWPNFCYIQWTNKRLGASPIWPFMSYTVRKKPTGNHLTNTDKWFEPTRTLTGNVYDNFWAVSGAQNYIELSAASSPSAPGDYSSDIRPLDLVRLTGNALPDQDLTVVSTSITAVTVGTPPFVRVIAFRTRITFEEDLTGIDDQGQIQMYIEAKDEGANAAHAIADMLFEKWPQGAALSTSDWDIDSLDDMAADTFAENLRTSWVAQEARTVEERFGAGLQDLGYMVPVDVATGLVRFDKLREPPGGGLKHIDNKMLVDKLPELEKFLGERPVDFMIFGFPDRDLNFRDMTVGRMEDGQIGFLEVARSRTIPITITTHFGTASNIANRRTQEEMAQNSVWTIITNRGTREILPGEAVTADFSPEVLRVLEVEPVPDSNEVKLKITADTYGVQASTFIDQQPPLPPGVQPAQQDIAFALIEVPEWLDGVPPQTVMIPRIRAHNQIDRAALHLSADGSTYSQITTTTVHNPGGQLTTALTSDGFFEPEDGEVQMSILGPDVAQIIDYTGDDTNWRLGKQLAIIVSASGVEICFLKKVTAVSGDIYSLDGLIRARYDTVRLDHDAGAQVFIVDVNDLTAIQDSLLAPEVTRYCKTQPEGNGVVSLTSVPDIAALLYGKGVRPAPIAALRVTAPNLSNSYPTGADVTLKWDYPTPRTPGTSAGFQEAGAATGTTAPEGDFLVELLTMADALVFSDSTATNSYTFSNATIIAELGSQVSFKVRITQLRDGYASDPVTITVEKV